MSQMITEKTVVLAIDQQVTGELPDGDMVILSLKNGVYYGLNSVGARIWTMIKKPMSVQDICDALLEEYDVDRFQCTQEVIRLLNELGSYQLISLQSEDTYAG